MSDTSHLDNQYTSDDAKQLAARLLAEQGVEISVSEILGIVRAFHPHTLSVVIRGNIAHQISDAEFGGAATSAEYILEQYRANQIITEQHEQASLPEAG